jgi:hypothetical protein
MWKKTWKNMEKRHVSHTSTKKSADVSPSDLKWLLDWKQPKKCQGLLTLSINHAFSPTKMQCPIGAKKDKTILPLEVVTVSSYFSLDTF